MTEGNGAGAAPAEEKTDEKKERRAPVRRPMWLILPATWKTVVDGPEGAHDEPDTWFVTKHDSKESIRKELERRGVDPKKPETLKHMRIVRMDEVPFTASTQVLLEF